MNVLVAGGAGFIGANLIQRLLRLGANVRATLYRKGPVILDQGIEYLWCDLTKMADCEKAVSGVEFVFLCAAKTSGAAIIESNPLIHVTPNILINAQMLEAAYWAKVDKVIWLSSNVAYPPSGDRPVKEEELFLGDPYGKYFAAGWMKRYSEVLCRLYSEKLDRTMSTVVLRPSNVYGPYDDYDFGTSHMTAALVRRVVERHDPLIIWGNGEDIRDLIYVDDFIDAMIMAADKIDSYDPINIGLGRGYSVKQVAQLLLEIDGFTDARIEFDHSKPSMIPIRLLDTRKAERVLEFRATTGLREGLVETIEWYREFYQVHERR